MLVFIHVILFFTSFAFVGFWPMLVNLISFAFVFSAYRSMQEFSMWIYIISLCVAMGVGVWQLFSTKYGNVQLLFKIVNVAMYCVNFAIFVKPWREYRTGGGFYSDIKVDKLPEDDFLHWAGRILGKAGDKIAEKVDEKVVDPRK